MKDERIIMDESLGSRLDIQRDKPASTLAVSTIHRLVFKIRVLGQTR